MGTVRPGPRPCPALSCVSVSQCVSQYSLLPALLEPPPPEHRAQTEHYPPPHSTPLHPTPHTHSAPPQKQTKYQPEKTLRPFFAPYIYISTGWINGTHCTSALLICCTCTICICRVDGGWWIYVLGCGCGCRAYPFASLALLYLLCQATGQDRECNSTCMYIHV